MMSSKPVSRPPKRTGSRSLSPKPLPPPSNPSTPKSKRERSPSPLFVERRLVTSGTKRFAPVPNDCLLSCIEYKHNRSEWVARCVKEVEALNLIPGRKLIRDDGLIIDWRSHVPVWSDTLKPDPLDLAATIMLAHRSNAQWRRPSIRKQSPQKSVTSISAQGRRISSPPMFGDVSDAEPPLKKRLPVPPRPSSKHRNNSSQPVSCSERPRLPDETERETASHSPLRDPVSSLADRAPILSDISPQHVQVAVPRTPPSSVRDRLIAPCTSSAAEEAMSEMTLDYLRRYVQTYEADRASLASAYAGNTSFAYRVLQVVQNIGGGASSIRSPKCSSSGSKRTRLDIVTTLLTLPSLHPNAQNSATAQIEYDIFYLGARLGMFVRKEVDVSIEDDWPLVATAHQILVFQT